METLQFFQLKAKEWNFWKTLQRRGIINGCLSGNLIEPYYSASISRGFPYQEIITTLARGLADGREQADVFIMNCLDSEE